MALIDDFAPYEIKPSVLFDLELDDAERNFWTGHYQVEVNGKAYLPLPGLEGGISVRQSLEIEDLTGGHPVDRRAA